jgi:hypothetical protein
MIEQRRNRGSEDYRHERKSKTKKEKGEKGEKDEEKEKGKVRSGKAVGKGKTKR